MDFPLVHNLQCPGFTFTHSLFPPGIFLSPFSFFLFFHFSHSSSLQLEGSITHMPWHTKRRKSKTRDVSSSVPTLNPPALEMAQSSSSASAQFADLLQDEKKIS